LQRLKRVSRAQILAEKFYQQSELAWAAGILSRTCFDALSVLTRLTVLSEVEREGSNAFAQELTVKVCSKQD
jgi:hypothetical protein